MFECPPELWHISRVVCKITTDLWIVSSLGRLLQVVCSSAALFHVRYILWFRFQLLKLIKHGYPHVVVKGVQDRLFGSVTVVRTLLAEPFFLFSCEIRSWKLCFHQFGIHQVNRAWSNTFVQSCLLNKWATFGCMHLWGIAIFMLRYFILLQSVLGFKIYR